MKFRTIAMALVAAATTMLPAVESNAAPELPHLTEYTMTISLQDGAFEPSWTAPRSELPTAKRWDCASNKQYTNDTATFTVTCVPKLPNVTLDADLPDFCRPGVQASINSMVAGNNVSGTATCGSASASCTAVAVQPSPPWFHGDCHIDAPEAVPGTSVQCAVSWPIVQINTAWSVSCHDHA